jgi:hypothetical protein
MLTSLFTLFLLTNTVLPFTGHNKYHVRELATNFLGHLRPFSYPTIFYGTRHKDFEIKNRCHSLFTPADRLIIIDHWLNHKLFPYLDGTTNHPFVLPYHAIIQSLEQFEKLPGNGDLSPNRVYPFNWPEYRRATRCYVRRLLFEGYSFAIVEDFLNQLWLAEFHKFFTRAYYLYPCNCGWRFFLIL